MRTRHQRVVTHLDETLHAASRVASAQRALPSRIVFTALAIAGVSAGTSLATAVRADAATLKVTTTTDELATGDGSCSLREAIFAVDFPGSVTDCGVADKKSNTIVLGAKRYEAIDRAIQWRRRHHRGLKRHGADHPYDQRLG